MSERIRTIRLYGKLGATYGRVHQLAVGSAREAIRALCVLLPGFEAELMGAHEKGVVYALFNGRQNLAREDLDNPPGRDEIRIAPMLQGSKRAGALQTIVGAVLVVVGVVDAELSGYVIRYHTGQNTSWGDANALHTGMLLASPYQALNKPAGALTLMIKAVNKQGVFSDEPAVIFSAFGDALVANVVEDFDFHAMGYPGSVYGGGVVAGKLHANGTSAFYGNDAANFFALDGTQAFYVDNYMEMVYTTVPFMPSAVATGSKLTLDLSIDGATTRIEHRISGSEPFWPTDETSAFYGADVAPFYGDTAIWVSWPGSVITQRAQYQFRFTTGTGGKEGVIATCRAVIDVPDIDEKLNDVAISAQGTRLPIVKAYSVIKNLQLSLQDSGGAAATVRWEDKSADLGPMVRCFNKDNVPVAGVVDAAIQGY